MVAYRPRRGWVLGACVVVAATVLLAGCTSLPGRPPPTLGSPTATVPGATTQERPSSTDASLSATDATPTTDAAPTTEATGAGDTDGGAGEIAGLGPSPDLPALPDLSAPVPTPTDRSQQLAGVIGTGDPITVQEAVDALNLVVPMPGATPSDLPPGPGLGPDLTMSLAVQFRDKMSPAQQKVVDGLTAEAGPSVTISQDGTVRTTAPGLRRPSASGLLRSAPPAISAAQQHIVDLVTQTLSDYATREPELPKMGVTVYFAPNQIKDWDMSTLSHPGDPATADITVYPLITNGHRGDVYDKFVFAHEIFHGMQDYWHGGNTDGPEWLIEGSAEFAGFDLYRGVAGLPLEWTQWFGQPLTGLADRSYDAWPFWESLRQYGVDPYPTIEAMVKASPADVPALLAAGGVDNTAFASFRSAQSLRRKQGPSLFDLAWPAPNPQLGPHDTGSQGPARGLGTFTMSGNGDYSHLQFLVGFSSTVDVVTVVPDATPITTLVDSGPLTISATTTFCLRTAGCNCPDGTAPFGGLTPASSPLIFSFPEQDAVSQAKVSDDTWDPKRYCEQKPKPVNDIGYSNGDPHMETFDGLHYDLMTPGEFVDVRDPKSTFQIQTRVEPYNSVASGSTAVAVGTDDGHRVTVTASSLIPAPTITVRVDGSITTQSSFTAGDVDVTSTGGSDWVITLQDRSVVDIAWHYGFFVTVGLSPTLAARVQGLLGNADGTITDDLKLPDGTSVAGEESDAFAKAWYVTDQTSLFDYDAGKNTEYYRKPPPPPARQPSPDQVAACRTALGATATADQIRDCAYDVTVTSDDSFVTAYTAVAADEAGGWPNAQPPSVPSSTESVPNNGSTPSAVPGGGAALTVSGTVAELPTFGQNPVTDHLDGSVSLVKDTVVIAKAANCVAGIHVWVTITSRADQQSVRPFVCDPTHLESYNADPQHSTVADGEVYALIGQTGDYDVTITTDSPDPVYLSVQLFADPTPTVVSAVDFTTKGYTGTLSGIADTVVAWAKTTDGMDWTTTGGGSLCRNWFYSVTFGVTGPTDLGSVCWQPPTVGMSPTGDQQVAFVIFSRESGAQQISVVPKK